MKELRTSLYKEVLSKIPFFGTFVEIHIDSKFECLYLGYLLLNKYFFFFDGIYHQLKLTLLQHT